jgi:glyoxylate reductase
MKIYITRQIPSDKTKEFLERGYEVDQNPEDRPLSKNELISTLRSKSYDAVLSMLTDNIDSEVFDASPSVKIFSNYAVGFNNIDIEEAKKRGVVVTNTPGNLTDSVAEHSLALLLAVSNKVLESDKFLREGKWTGFDPDIFLRNDLVGKTVGIVGAGRIGYRFGYILNKGFGLKIIYYDVKRNEAFENDINAEFKDKIEDVLSSADIISVNVPLMPETHHLINEKRLRMMKKSAIFINTSRGPVVDEVALVKILKEGLILGAGLDVFEFEPNLTEGLKDLPNVVLTPHIGSATFKAREDMAIIACQNILDFFDSKEMKNKVY